MQSSWPAAHSQALREYLAKGLSFSRIADAINLRFGTRYTRNAAIGRAQRMGLAPGRSTREGPKPPRKARAPRLRRLRKRKRNLLQSGPRLPKVKPGRRKKLRCVEIAPRHLALIELGCGDCRYPYGGDAEGEAITFCGHPQRPGSPYCTPHFHLTRGPGTATDRAPGAVLLRLAEAAA
jgi:GcrA cell cycle regulator